MTSNIAYIVYIYIYPFFPAIWNPELILNQKIPTIEAWYITAVYKIKDSTKVIHYRTVSVLPIKDLQMIDPKTVSQCINQFLSHFLLISGKDLLLKLF